MANKAFRAVDRLLINQVENDTLRLPTIPLWGWDTKSRTDAECQWYLLAMPDLSFIPCCTTAHSPLDCDYERVQVNLESVSNAVVVDLRR